MATILEKNVVRESKVTYNERNIQVTLTKEQEVHLKLKGLKSGDVKIGIEDLYKKLTGKDKTETPESVSSIVIKEKTNQKGDDKPMISLNDFRSLYLISGDFPYDMKVKLEQITVNLINDHKKKGK